MCQKQMKPKTIEARIDALFASGEGTLGRIPAFVDVLLRNQAEAEKFARRDMGLLILAWVVFYLISAGLIEEGQIANFKIVQLKAILVAGPPIVAALFYFFALHFRASSHLVLAIGRCYQYLLPSAYENDLEYLLPHPSFRSIESYLNGKTSSHRLGKLHSLWLRILSYLTTLLPLIALYHVATLMWMNSGLHWVVRAASIAVGFVFFVRGLLALLDFMGLEETTAGTGGT